MSMLLAVYDKAGTMFEVRPDRAKELVIKEGWSLEKPVAKPAAPVAPPAQATLPLHVTSAPVHVTSAPVEHTHPAVAVASPTPTAE